MHKKAWHELTDTKTQRWAVQKQVPQMASPQICWQKNFLWLADTFANVAICRFANPIFLLFADPIFVDLLPQIGKYINSLLKNIGLRCSTSNLYKIQISAEQTYVRIIGGFVEQGPKRGWTFRRVVSSSPSYGKKFADLRLEDWHT
jgi:hypothetical protein